MGINLGNYIVPNEVKNGICIDVGCNLGDFTKKYNDFFKKIYFIEAQTELFLKLEKRFNQSNNIIGFNRAVWSESNVKVNLVSHPNNDHGSVAVNSDYLNNDWTSQIVNQIETISLEDFLSLISEKNIDYLKIDCETSEYPFLFGKDLSMFRYIGIEIHSQMGELRYNELLEWIKQTHILIDGDDSFNKNYNKELLFIKLK
jgi:FkbM family methyltransferase